MTELEKLQEDFDRKVVDLQKNCKHEKLSEWREYYWAIGHSTGNFVKTCLRCGKIIKVKESAFNKKTRLELEQMNKKV